MKLSAFLRSSKQTARASRQIRPTCNDISRSGLRGFSQFCVLHAKTIHSTLLHGQNSTWIKPRNIKQIGFDMSTEWKQRYSLKYCKKYKKSACYMTDQLILFHLINLNNIGIQFRKRREIGFAMFAELKEIDWPLCFKNYKRFSCYMPDQTIILYFIAVMMSGFSFKTQNELVVTCLEKKE